MALGNTLLATYAEDELVRNYEYVSGAFVPLGVSSAFPHNPTAADVSPYALEPTMFWVQSDSYLFLMTANNSPLRSEYDVLNPSAGSVGHLSGSGGTLAAGGMGALSKDIDTVWERYSTNIHSQTPWLRTNAMGVPSITGLPVLNANDINTDISVSPKGTYITVCGVTGAPVMVKRLSLPGVTPPNVSAPSTLTLEMAPEILRFSGDELTLIALSRNERLGQVYAFDGTSLFTKTHDLQLVADTGAKVHKAEQSGDGRVLAVSFVNAGVYTTKLYTRASGYMVPLQAEIPNFGKDLTFSSDGNLLVDATALKAFIRNGDVFEEHDEAMVNVASDIITARLSAAPLNKAASASVYIAALEPFATCGVDWDNLKFTLLTSAAAIDDTDATIAEVTNSGAWEVTQAAWPSGGIQIENVAAGMGSTTFDFVCDPLVWLTFGSSMTWRYGVIYDATSGIPLVSFDYYGERLVGNNREVTFDFPNDVFVRLTR